jgi:hypothetical protein
MHQLMESDQQRLQSVVESLNMISESLTSRRNRDSVAEQEQIAAHIGREVRQALTPLFNPIRSAIEDLNKTLHASRPNKALSTDDMEQLVDLLSERVPRDRIGAASPDAGRTRWRLPGMKSSLKNGAKGS